jgi:ubiquinone/menaquinone biosynthesis C-methylase UbiE
MRPDLERYDRFGWDYELHNPLSEKAVSWYAKFASDTGGPVLELACGT